MSSKKKSAGLHIALPPRLELSLFQADSDASSSSPSPHTPMPYEYSFSPDLAAQHTQNAMHFGALEMSCALSSKRSRDEQEAKVEPAWTDEEMDVIQTTLLHPFRPVAIHYPPGELPPPNVIDELTNQIMAYAFRLSPTKRPEGDPDATHLGWVHTWDATRKMLFELALAESKFGHDERKVPGERAVRPGLRRVDSMDFLDQAEDRSSDKTGRTLRLSTSLQNSAKEPAAMPMNRSSTVSDTSSAGPSTPLLTTFTLTPASPLPAPPPRRKAASRGIQARPARPTSLLQRGRSFTASDLQAEAEAEVEPDAVLDKAKVVTSPDSSPKQNHAVQQLPTVNPRAPRLTRSQSSTLAMAHPRHVLRDAFLAPAQPSSTDRATLAIPLDIETKPSCGGGGAVGWSDSEDEAPKKLRHVKKIKGGGVKQQIKAKALALGQSLRVEALDGGLKSPFEEKAGMFF